MLYSGLLKRSGRPQSLILPSTITGVSWKCPSGISLREQLLYKTAPDNIAEHNNTLFIIPVWPVN
jgi:hypothetical protein